jgi:uncharacterized membrane protein
MVGNKHLSEIKKIKKIVATSILTLLVCLASRLFICFPETKGLLNMGEPIFLFAALLMGPSIGAFVGGAGFALAYLILGYPYYIISALTIKSIAGFVIGNLNKRRIPMKKNFSLTLGLLLTLFLGLIGGTIYSGVAYLGYVKTLYLGERVLEQGGLITCSVYVPLWFWIAVPLVMFFYISFLELKKKKSCAWTILSVLSATLIMVLGYWVYEMTILHYLFDIKVDAVANLGTNAGQTIVSANMALLFIKIGHLGRLIASKSKGKKLTLPSFS